MIDWQELGRHSGLLVHAAALVQLSGFLMRDQLRLRALVLTGNAFYALYYFAHPATPLWDAIFWSAAMLVVNVVMIVVIARSRRMHAVDDDTLQVYGAFASMEPGDFRRLMRIGETRVARAPTTLTRLGEPPEHLVYVISGDLEIARTDRTIRMVERAMFIAEVGFLLGTPASATVVLGAGGRYVVWDRRALADLMARRSPIAHAIERALNRDMAEKIRAS